MQLFNHCFKGSYINNEVVQQKRRNATEFESRTNGCVEYNCFNDKGPLAWSICNSSDDVNRVCIEDKCIENKEPVENTWVVEITVVENSIKPSDINTTELIINISLISAIEIEEIEQVGIETNSDGYVIRVVVYHKDEKTAQVVADRIKDFHTGGSCEYEVLCRTKTVRVVAEWMEVSCTHETTINFFIMMMLVMIIVGL